MYRNKSDLRIRRNGIVTDRVKREPIGVNVFEGILAVETNSGDVTVILTQRFPRTIKKQLSAKQIRYMRHGQVHKTRITLSLEKAKVLYVVLNEFFKKRREKAISVKREV